MKACYLVERLGPYHVARLNRAATHGEIAVIELQPASSTYAWRREDPARMNCRVWPGTLDQSGRIDDGSLETMLDAIRPAVVFINGWADRGGLTALRWCLRQRVPAVLMSDSQENDEPRIGWKEWIKRRVIAGCDAAFVAGQRHVDYLRVLGFGDKPITFGYDVVDNEHFAGGAQAARRDPGARMRLDLPEKYFLCVSRFVAKKNLPLLLRAFAAYRRDHPTNGWDLVLLGDGEQRAALEAQIVRDGLTGQVHLRGFLQYEELPAFYGLAGALVLASTTDQWGLAVNEAMASGLPVLVSRPCGCVPELVHDGRNGFHFDPRDETALAALLDRLSAPGTDRAAMAAASCEIIAAWSLDRFADGFWTAAGAARQDFSGRPRSVIRRWFLRWFLALLLRMR